MQPESHIDWFVVITRWGQWKKITEKLNALHINCFIPPAYNTLVFFQTQRERALTLVNAGEIKGHFIIDHETHTLLVVPPEQMEAFIRVTTEYPEAEVNTDIPIRKGTRVKVIRGPLKDIEGEVVEHPNGVQLLVRVKSLICARVNIAREDVVPLPENG